MKNIAARFSAAALAELKKQLNIELTDEHDYSDDEILDIYERVTDDFPYAFDENGEPLRMGRIFEEIVDVLIALNK